MVLDRYSTGIYDILCDSSQFKLCKGELDSSCANRKVTRYKYQNGQPASCGEIVSLCGGVDDIVRERCPETCGVEKCKGNSLKYDSHGCVYKRRCNPGTFPNKITNKCVYKGISNKNIIKKQITTNKFLKHGFSFSFSYSFHFVCEKH